MYKAFVIFILLVCMVSLLPGCDSEKKPVISYEPSYRIGKTAITPVIDGILNEDCWKNAEVKSLVSCADGKKSSYPTTVRALYDDGYLYIGFECQDPDAASTITEKDGPVSEQEYISVYINAGSDLKTYAVIDIAPTGAISDAFVLNYDDGSRKKVLSDWDCEGLRSSVSVHGEGAEPGTNDRFWTVELALPLTEFVTASHIPPTPEDTWRINFYRVELTNVRDISALASTGSENFHKPSSFAWLLFEN
jgi:hypothetical protein